MCLILLCSTTFATALLGCFYVRLKNVQCEFKEHTMRTSSGGTIMQIHVCSHYCYCSSMEYQNFEENKGGGSFTLRSTYSCTIKPFERLRVATPMRIAYATHLLSRLEVSDASLGCARISASNLVSNGLNLFRAQLVMCLLGMYLDKRRLCQPTEN